MKRVKQISLDILVDEQIDGEYLAEYVMEQLNGNRKELLNGEILGSSFRDDISEEYRKSYPELLNDSKEIFDGEEMCPHCDHLNCFKWDGKTMKMTCKNCGEEILLCSMCDMDKINCSKCPNEKEKMLEQEKVNKKILDNAYTEIDSFRDKLGETFFDAVMEEDNSTYEMSKSIISTFDSCKDDMEFKVADNMLIAICGYSLETLINRIKERDKQKHKWESC